MNDPRINYDDLDRWLTTPPDDLYDDDSDDVLDYRVEDLINEGR